MPLRNRQKLFETGVYYHAYARGHLRRTIFRDEADRVGFMCRIREGLRRQSGVEVAAYALMPNHVHLVLRSIEIGQRISPFMSGLLAGHARTFNDRRGAAGPVFDQSHYRARRITDGADLVGAIAYVHLNPATNALRSAHTSDAYYRGQMPTPWWLVIDEPLKMFGDVDGYNRFVAGTAWMRDFRARSRT